MIIVMADRGDRSYFNDSKKGNSFFSCSCSGALSVLLLHEAVRVLQTDKYHRHSDRKASSWECWRQEGSRRKTSSGR
jgi:hypothetical protein